MPYKSVRDGLLGCRSYASTILAAGNEVYRILRGGSFLFSEPDALTVTIRFDSDPAIRDFDYGFRCAANP